jgi:putative flippase GtrA
MIKFRRFFSPQFLELVRFYQAAVVNTAFGLSAYSALIYLGLNVYVAQFISHVAGTFFNYFSYSRHVFRDASPSKLRFFVSYVGNYLLGLLTLFVVRIFIQNEYLAGFATVLFVSAVNYIVLKFLVFRFKSS